MKRISIFTAMAALLLGFTSCEQDRDPVYQVPTDFVLNTPAMQDQYIDLNADGTLELVTSQPDYGYSAVANYSAEMSLTEDFANPVSLEATDKTQARMTIKQENVAIAMMELQGIDSEEKYAEVYPGGATYSKVYFRAICQLDGVESSRIVSNVVSYNYLKPYFAIKLPGFIYLVGQPEGWAGPAESNAEHYAPWRLFEPEDAIGSKVYSGVFDIPAGSASFRFYTALTGWDGGDSYGSQEADSPIEYPEFTDGSFTTAMVKGKGSFSFPGWAGGKMTITVDMSDANNMTVTVQAGEHSTVVTKYIYLVGSLSGWQAPGLVNEAAYASYRLADTTGDGIYTGSFDCPKGELSFRFALSLAPADDPDPWANPDQIGFAENDGNNACEFGGGIFNGPYVSGKGNWTFNLPEAATVDMLVNTNDKTVTYTLH